jgi:hypothetical protein
MPDKNQQDEQQTETIEEDPKPSPLGDPSFAPKQNTP